MNDLIVGQRVRVKIADRKQWAVGAADALNGCVGHIEEIKPLAFAREMGILVRFDQPAPKWWANQSPATAHWFEARDLEAE